MARNSIKYTDGSEFLQLVRKRCKSKDLYVLLERAALSAEFRWGRATTSGVMLAGPHGIAATHLAPSTLNRGLQNFEATLRRTGLL